MPGSVFIVDEFDRAANETSGNFTDLMKGLSDFSVDCTIILVGVSDTVDQLIADHASISRSLVQILLPRMVEKELREILSTAEKALDIGFSTPRREFDCSHFPGPSALHAPTRITFC